AAADFHQRADDVADHVVEKSVGFDFDCQPLDRRIIAPLPCPAYSALIDDFQCPHVTNCGFAVTARSLKTGEVVSPAKPFSRGLHRSNVDRAGQMPAVAVLTRVPSSPNLQLVAVALADRVANGVEVRSCIAELSDRNVGRQ